MESIKSRLRRANNSRRYNAEARAKLKGLDATLSDRDKALCNAYAKDALGSRQYAPWLYVYCAVAGKFHEGWIPDNYYKQYVVWPSSYGNLSARRALAGCLFGHENFPDVGYLIDGRLIAVSGETVSDRQFADLLFAKSDKVIFKTDSSGRGEGICFFSRNSFDSSILKTLGNGVFQNVIRQHEVFDPLSQNALATLRLTTVKDSKGITSVRGTLLRVGRTSDTFVKPDNQISIAFDSESGMLSDLGYRPDWNKTTVHPDTGQTFAGVQIPNVAACTSLVTRLHDMFPFIDCIGWDLAIDQDGQPHVLEWNSGHNGIKLLESIAGPVFRDLDWADRWQWRG